MLDGRAGRGRIHEVREDVARFTFIDL
jgi:hypothetical protein